MQQEAEVCRAQVILVQVLGAIWPHFNHTWEAVLTALMAAVMRFGQLNLLSKVQAPRGRMPTMTTCMLGAFLLMYATMCLILQMRMSTVVRLQTSASSDHLPCM